MLIIIEVADFKFRFIASIFVEWLVVCRLFVWMSVFDFNMHWPDWMSNYCPETSFEYKLNHIVSYDGDDDDDSYESLLANMVFKTHTQIFIHFYMNSIVIAILTTESKWFNPLNKLRLFYCYQFGTFLYRIDLKYYFEIKSTNQKMYRCSLHKCYSIFLTNIMNSKRNDDNGKNGGYPIKGKLALTLRHGIHFVIMQAVPDKSVIINCFACMHKKCHSYAIAISDIFFILNCNCIRNRPWQH